MMNNQKDIQGHGLISHKATTGMDAFSVTLSKKCERLATAIYLVTNFLSDTEPLKSRLRTLSLDFVRDASIIKSGSSATETNVLEALRGNISETLSLLELAFIAGLVSEMNFTILKREYKTLRDTIDIKKTSRESHTDKILGDTFFGTSFHEEGGSTTPALSQRSDLADFAKSHRAVSTKARSEGRTFMNSVPVNMSDRTPKGHEISPRSDLKNSGPKVGPLSASSPRATTDVTKESRRTRILKLVKDNREVAIKDIVTHFPDLSEKTIQRELVAMSDSGILKKSGERRWSRYSLA